MESWRDQGIILSIRPHGDNGGVISALCEGRGRHNGYVPGARSSKMRGVLSVGNVVELDWQSRTSDNLGRFEVSLIHSFTADFLDSALRLAVLQSACALCDKALPEREGHPGLFHGLHTLFSIMAQDTDKEIWLAAYVMWELSLLREMGFALELDKCALGGNPQNLSHVSPKTGRAVSADYASPYKDRLLVLPEFLKPGGQGGDLEDIRLGLTLTQTFLEKWVFAQSYDGVPEVRRGIVDRVI